MSIFETGGKSHVQGKVAVILAVIAAGGAWLWSRSQPPEVKQASQASVAAQAPAATAQQPAPSTPEVSADKQQALLDALSTNPLVRAWIARGDVVHRWAVVAGNLAEGETPRRELAFLAPAAPFEAQTSGTSASIAPQSYQRYDAFADAVATLDAAAFANVYRALHPALEASYRALGYPGASLDAVAAKALGRIEQAPVETGLVLIDKAGGYWAFQSSRLEALAPVEKHLLRMGPRNTKLLQVKAGQLRSALGLAGSAAAGHTQ